MREILSFALLCLVLWCIIEGPAAVGAEFGDAYAAFTTHANSCGHGTAS